MRLSTTWEPRAAVVVVVVVVVGVVCTICRRRREAKPRCARAPSPLDGHNHAQQLVDELTLRVVHQRQALGEDKAVLLVLHDDLAGVAEERVEDLLLQHRKICAAWSAPPSAASLASLAPRSVGTPTPTH